MNVGLILVILGFILYVMAFKLLNDYKNKEPVWLKSYLVFLIGYSVVVPAVLVHNFAKAFFLPGEVELFLIVAIDMVFLMLSVRLLPRRQKRSIKG